MIKKILSLILPQESEPTPASEETIRLAAISLLVQVAKADHSLSDQEESKLVELINAHFNQSKHIEHDELIELAMAKSDASTSLYEFTSLINENYSYEEHLIRRVADLIYLPHVNFIEAKLLAEKNNMPR